MTTPNEFREFGKAMIDYAADYLENIRERPVLPDVRPGYLRNLLPDEAPEKPEEWKDVMADIERLVMPGVTHWQHPNFFAYFPAANSYPAIVADILSGAINCIGFTWLASPACTELEMAMMNWLGRMLQLPDEFLFTPGGKGGGVIQGTASEATMVALLAARARAAKRLEIPCHLCPNALFLILRFQEDHPENTDKGLIQSRLVAYGSSLAHSSVERAGMLGGIKMRLLDVDPETKGMRGETLLKAIEEDKVNGLIPFFAVCTLGTTSCCSFDHLQELGEVSEKNGIWLHIDAAYAGSAFICPEYRPYLNGVEKADSFSFGPHKWLLVNFDCSCMWVRDQLELVEGFTVDPLYLQVKTFVIYRAFCNRKRCS